MTASELYEIVKGLPGEIPRNGISFGLVNGRPAVFFNGIETTVDHAVLLFEASVARWLDKYECFALPYNGGYSARRYTAPHSHDIEEVVGGPTKIHALASAVRAVQEEGK